MLLPRLMLSLAVAFALFVATGCQSTSTDPSSSAMAPSRGVLITTGQGQSTVLLPSTGGNGVAMLASTKVPKCAQCEADSAAYFKSGNIDPKCAVCGSVRTPLSGTN